MPPEGAADIPVKITLQKEPDLLRGGHTDTRLMSTPAPRTWGAAVVGLEDPSGARVPCGSPDSFLRRVGMRVACLRDRKREGR